MKKYLLKLAVPAVLSLASLVGCASTQVIDVNIRPNYTQKDKQYISRVEKVDKKLVKHNDPKKVDLEILVDSAYIRHQDRRDRDWWYKIKRAVEWAGDAFKEKFGIDIEIDSVKYTKFDSVGDAYYLFADLRLKHDPKQFDGIIAFTGVPCGRVQGIAELNGNHSMVMSTYQEGIVVQHELSHLYGALDIKPDHPLYGRVWSVMSYHHILGNTNQWDEQNTSRIERNKNRDWKYNAGELYKIRKHINGFSTLDLRRRVARLFCYSKARRFHQKGLDLGKDLVNMFPNDSRIRYYYSQVLKKMKSEDVVEQYRKIIGLNPRDADILNVIAWDLVTEYGIRDFDVINIAKKAVQEKPKDYIIDTLGWAYYKKGDLENAVTELERACETTKDPEIFAHLIEAYVKKNDYKGYCSASERLIKLDPSEGTFYAAHASGLMDLFYKKLDSKKKEHVLDLSLKAYEIYPVKNFANLVRFAYALNYERWEDPEFRRKYDGRIPN